MFGKRRKKQEWVPWYRRKDYKGSLTEAEKRELDAFQMQDNHPATKYEDLPDEVQSYIIGLELQIYDFKQGQAMAKPILVSIVGAISIFLSYKGLGNAGNLGYVIGIFLLTAAWFLYSREWRKNADEFFPDGEGSPSRTDEGIRTEWELTYITERKMETPD